MTIFFGDTLKAEIDERVPDLIATRRDFHEHPELAFEEVRTSQIVAQRLKACGLEVQTGVAKTGVVGILRGEAADAEARTLAIRADMDALPIFELNEVDYRSQIDGKMHACGHDGHTAIALTVADILSKRRHELKGNVKFLFQPAEESIGGAHVMVEEGAMQGVDGVIGLHLISALPLGLIGVRSGTVFASADKLIFTVHGKGGHAAMPQFSVDPVVIAAQIITALQTLISRETSPFSPAVITIAQIQAGSAFNIIPQQAQMLGTMRAYSTEHRAHLIRRIQEVASGIATAMGGSCTVKIEDGCPPCVNDPAMTQLVYGAAVATVGEHQVETGEAVLTAGSDDMGHFLNAAPGCYFIVGTQNTSKETDYPHHHPRFNIDEDALPTAVEVLTRAALDFLRS
ncbi:M20 metallopeptidase family protein [Tengunoibacter tsumagoiensis]|uniref:Peptidase M20 n=1 Tax=Tengunoibacter tsumagoiensis TaxID=2014871 RepID=A0A401ZUL4_9CHLR|nr:amidohydrolase [Tengunoibacter tsumagoiensis]GCE10492.1 peptidase M20 [Tengunoibacter tsumagoiensis]